MTQAWNPEQAGAELKSLFDKVDEICSKPIYQDSEGSTDTDQSEDAATDQTTAVNESQGIHQL